MPRVTVRLFAALRELAGSSSVEAEGATVGEVVQALSARYGERFASDRPGGLGRGGGRTRRPRDAAHRGPGAGPAASGLGGLSATGPTLRYCPHVDALPAPPARRESGGPHDVQARPGRDREGALGRLPARGRRDQGARPRLGARGAGRGRGHRPGRRVLRRRDDQRGRQRPRRHRDRVRRAAGRRDQHLRAGARPAARPGRGDRRPDREGARRPGVQALARRGGRPVLRRQLRGGRGRRRDAPPRPTVPQDQVEVRPGRVPRRGARAVGELRGPFRRPGGADRRRAAAPVPVGDGRDGPIRTRTTGIGGSG